MDRSQLIGDGTHVRELAVHTLDGESCVVPRRGRAAIIIVAHDPTCPECAAYRQQLGGSAAEIDSWDCDIVIVSDEALPVDVETPAVVVVDQWGEVKEVAPAGSAHSFPLPDALISWARYLAVQCPECEGESL